MTDPNKIAEGLTEAQQASFRYWLGLETPLRAVTIFQHHGNMEDLRALKLIEKRPCNGFFKHRDVITDIGRAVAAELEGRE